MSDLQLASQLTFMINLMTDLIGVVIILMVGLYLEDLFVGYIRAQNKE